MDLEYTIEKIKKFYEKSIFIGDQIRSIFNIINSCEIEYLEDTLNKKSLEEIESIFSKLHILLNKINSEFLEKANKNDKQLLEDQNNYKIINSQNEGNFLVDFLINQKIIDDNFEKNKKINKIH